MLFLHIYPIGTLGVQYGPWAPLITKLSLLTPQLFLQLLPLLDHLPEVVAPVLQDQLGVKALSEGLSAALDPVGRALGHAHCRALEALTAADWEPNHPTKLGFL